MKGVFACFVVVSLARVWNAKSSFVPDADLLFFNAALWRAAKKSCSPTTRSNLVAAAAAAARLLVSLGAATAHKQIVRDNQKSRGKALVEVGCWKQAGGGEEGEGRGAQRGGGVPRAPQRKSVRACVRKESVEEK